MLPLGLSNLSGNSPFKRSGNYASLRESALPSNIQRREQSRISLILEENAEEDSSSEARNNDFNDLVSRMMSAVATAAAGAGEDVVDRSSQGQGYHEVSPAGGYPSPGFPELMQNQVNNDGRNNNNSGSNSNFSHQLMGRMNAGLTDVAAGQPVVGGASLLWGNQMAANNSLSNTTNNNSSGSSNNNNNNGPEWRLPQLPAIFDTKVERPPVQVSISHNWEMFYIKVGTGTGTYCARLDNPLVCILHKKICPLFMNLTVNPAVNVDLVSTL